MRMKAWIALALLILVAAAGCSSNAERLCQLYGHDDIDTKRSTTRYLHLSALLTGDVPEIATSGFKTVDSV